jgi:acyl-ACP thioesterase
MATKTAYKYAVAMQDVDFALRATLNSVCSNILNTAGIDAQGKNFGLDALSQQSMSWVLSRFAVELDYRPEQYAEYNIDTWVNTNTRMLSTRNFELSDSDGKNFARAVSQWCVIDFKRRVPVNLEELHDKFAPHLCDAPSPCDPPRKVLGVAPQQTIEHKVVYSDIDFNRHVNTMRYIVMMIDMLPIEYMEQNRSLRLDVHFMHECRLGQVLIVGYEQRDNVSLFEIKSDDGAVACRASIEWQ